VLIVDRDREFAMDIAAVLHGLARCQHVGNSVRATAEILRCRPGLLWLDLELERFYAPLGGFEGIAFMEILRRRLESRLPVIVVSSRLSHTATAQLGGLGVLGCFEKPPVMEKLVAAIEPWVG
jgi:DNA-binding response OmpR family regulator